MNLNFYCLGKYSLKGLNSECERYKKMLSKFCNVNETLIKETAIQNFDDKSIQKKLKEDDSKIIKLLKQKSVNVLMDIRGKDFDSVSFSNCLDEIFQNNCNVNFIIGGSYGVGEEIRKISDYKISLSRLTFSHEIARLVLYEQVFRSLKILNCETYNK